LEAAKPVSRWGISSLSRDGGSRSSKPPTRRQPRGAHAGDSLRLFTPARYDGLPGRSFPGDPDHYPGRDEVVSYLVDYAHDFELPVELGSRVRSIRRAEDGYVVELDHRTYESEQVVVATGPFPGSAHADVR
jgi:cation diffusion facilitator CzcD-associated flavoprotein CzcO